MKVFVALEDRANGMMFNHRRLSRDRVLYADIAAEVGDGTLFLSPYSEPMFADIPVKCSVSENFLDAAGGGCAFVEDRALLPYCDRITELVVYRWGRVYPSDMRFDLDLGTFTKIGESEFVGSSHEKITKEIYRK